MTTLAEAMFPGLPLDNHTAPAAPAVTGLPSVAPAAPAPAAPAAAKPAPAAATPTPPSPSKPAESHEAELERLFGYSKDTPEAKAAEAAAEAKPAALPDFIDPAHPDASIATPIVQELGLQREQTAKLVALHQQMTAAAIDRQSATWAAASQQLPPQDIADARSAMQQFGSAELRAALEQSGMGNHPALVKAFAKALRSNPYRGF